MAPVGCAVGPPITGQLTLEGIPILGLVDTGASVTCLGFSIWWRYRNSRGQYTMSTVNPCKLPAELSISTSSGAKRSSRSSQLHSYCGSGITTLPHGMDIMRPLRVHIDVTNGTATPAQPDPQTVHLNAAQSQQQRKEMLLSRAGLRSPQTADPPPTQSNGRKNRC